MSIDLVSILLGFEHIMPDRQSIRDLRLYLQDPPTDPEKSFPLFRVAETVLAGNEKALPLITALKSLTMDQSPKRLFKVLSETDPNDELLKRTGRAMEKCPDVNWNDALSKGQLMSKIWLIDELKKLNLHLGTVFVLGGWLGVLPALMFRDGTLRFDKIRSFDIDSSCALAADSLNQGALEREWKFKATTADMFEIDYRLFCYNTLRPNNEPTELTEAPRTIINTSCDHVAPFQKWWSLIPKGKFVILQNNDFFEADEDHVNNVRSLADMKAQAPMTEIYYEGVLELPKYNRFMLIGKK